VLADELRAIDSYLLLERARFGDRLKVRLEISPESLTTRIPHLCL
jgi:two-component system LytT family sensor kinase